MQCAVCTRPGITTKPLPQSVDEALQTYRRLHHQPHSEDYFHATISYVDMLSAQLGAGPQALPPFQSLLRLMDAGPQWWTQAHTDATLGRYGQVIRAMFHDPDVSEETISDLLDNMEFRLIQLGLSARPVVWLRYEYVMLARGVRESEQWFDSWVELDPSALCACRGCDPTRLLNWLIWDNRVEAAARLTESFLSNSARMMCASQPQGLLAAGLDSLIQTRRVDAAHKAVSLGIRLAMRRPYHGTLVTFAHTLSRCGQADVALQLVHRALDYTPENRYSEALAMASVARVLISAPTTTPPALFWPGFSGSAVDVADQLVTAAYNTAKRFDHRHDTDVTTLHVRRVLASEDLPHLDISTSMVMRQLISPAPLASGVSAPAAVNPSSPLRDAANPGGAQDTTTLGAKLSPVAKAVSVKNSPPQWSRPEELAPLVRAAFTEGTALEVELLLDQWATRSTPESAKTAAGVWLDCVRHCHDPDLEPHTDSRFVKRAAANAPLVGTIVTQTFVKCALLCDSDSWSQADTDYLAEQLANTSFLADDVLAPIAVAQIVGAATTLGKVAFLRANKPVFSAALGRTPAGKQVYLQWNMLSRGKEPESCLEPMNQVAAQSRHGADWLAVFCSRVAERCAHAGDWSSVSSWLERTTPHILEMTCSARLLELVETAKFLVAASLQTRCANPARDYPPAGPIAHAPMDEFLAALADQLMILSLDVCEQPARELLHLLVDFDAHLAAVEWAEILLDRLSAHPSPVFAGQPEGSTTHAPTAGAASAASANNNARLEVLALLAIASDQLGDQQSAAIHAQAAVNASTMSPRVWHLAGTAASEAEDFACAADRFATAAELCLRQGAMREVAHCVAAEAECIHTAEGLAAALVVVSRWEATFKDPQASVPHFGAWAQLAVAIGSYAVLSAEGDTAGALRAAQAAVGHAVVVDHPEALLVARRRCLAALWAAGRTRETMSFADEVLGCYDPSSRHPALWDCAQAYATLAESLGEPETARRVRHEYLGSNDVPPMSINAVLSRDVAHRRWPGA